MRKGAAAVPRRAVVAALGARPARAGADASGAASPAADHDERRGATRLATADDHHRASELWAGSRLRGLRRGAASACARRLAARARRAPGGAQRSRQLRELRQRGACARGRSSGSAGARRRGDPARREREQEATTHERSRRRRRGRPSWRAAASSPSCCPNHAAMRRELPPRQTRKRGRGTLLHVRTVGNDCGTRPGRIRPEKEAAMSTIGAEMGQLQQLGQSSPREPDGRAADRGDQRPGQQHVVEGSAPRIASARPGRASSRRRCGGWKRRCSRRAARSAAGTTR